MDYLAGEGLETDTPLKFAEYLGSWLRDTPIDGTALTYADLEGADPHTDGEIWAQTLWSLRGRARRRGHPRACSPTPCASRRRSPRSSTCATRC